MSPGSRRSRDQVLLAANASAEPEQRTVQNAPTAQPHLSTLQENRLNTHGFHIISPSTAGKLGVPCSRVARSSWEPWAIYFDGQYLTMLPRILCTALRTAWSCVDDSWLQALNRAMGISSCEEARLPYTFSNAQPHSKARKLPTDSAQPVSLLIIRKQLKPTVCTLQEPQARVEVGQEHRHEAACRARGKVGV